MLPTPATGTARPDKKKLSLFFPGISSSDAQNSSANGSGAGAGAGSMDGSNLSPAPPTPVNAKEARRKQMIRDGLVILVSLGLSIAFLVFGPAGDFIAGRAFTVTTTNEVTYIYYNWTIQLPRLMRSLNMQAQNNRLVGNVLFTPAPRTEDHYRISIETTVPHGLFTFTPWTKYSTQESGFDIDVSDLVPNTYGIDYANIIVYLPSNQSYTALTWNTYPLATVPANLPIRKWNVAFDNLTQAGIDFDRVRVLTDGGGISSDGLTADQGYFQTNGVPIIGEYTIPTAHLTFNMSGEPHNDR